MEILESNELSNVSGGFATDLVVGYAIGKIVDHFYGEAIEAALDGMFGPAEDLSGMMIAA